MAFYDFKLFGLDSLDKMMSYVYADVREFCARKGLQLHMCSLTSNQLGLARSTDFPTGLRGYHSESMLFGILGRCLRIRFH